MRVITYIAVFLTAVFQLFARQDFDRGESRSQNSLISYQAMYLFHPDSSKTSIDVHYRIGQNFFIFVRDEAAGSKNKYVAHGELSVELLNEQRVSVARQIRQLALTRTTLPRETDRSPSLQGVVSLNTPPGTYTIVFSVDDRESGRTFMERSQKIVSRPVPSNSFEVSDVVFVQPPETHTDLDLVVATNRGGDVVFGEFGGVVGEIYRPSTSDTLSIRWTIRGRTDGFGQRLQNFDGTGYTEVSGLLDLAPQNQGVLYSLKRAGKNWYTFYIPLPLEKMEPGKYTLEVFCKSGTEKRQQTHQFGVIWPSRPFSFFDPELAIDALRHIASEADIEAMQSGPMDKRAQAFYGFWKSQSRDTSTAYNVALAEYYYRVDEAIRKFSTARENDGYKTDRGRIYVLYGAPQKSDRLLQPNSSPTEVWTYERLQRRFIFIDPSKNGNYILSQIETL